MHGNFCLRLFGCIFFCLKMCLNYGELNWICSPVFIPFFWITAVHWLRTIDWKTNAISLSLNKFILFINRIHFSQNWTNCFVLQICLFFSFHYIFDLRFVVEKQIDMVIVRQFIKLKFIGSPNSDEKNPLLNLSSKYIILNRCNVSGPISFPLRRILVRAHCESQRNKRVSSM